MAETAEVLVADDNPGNRELLATILRGAGLRVRVVSSGQAALDLVEASAPDLALLDVSLPDVDGYEVCRRVKALPARRDLPVIFTSGVAEHVDKVRGFAAGGVDYLTKPFERGEVLARVSTQIRMARLQRELLERNRQLSALNEEKNRLLGTVVHDLRTPLTVVAGYATFLGAGPLDDEQRDFVEQIRRTTAFMESLVNDLLDLAAIEAGSLQLRREEVDLREHVARVVELNRRLATRKDVRVELVGAATSVTARIDRGKIEQVLNNIIGNAVKFSPRGARVAVSLETDGDEAVVAVADEGEGIPAEELGALFQPFRVTSVRPTDGEKSTGLGLAIAHRIVAGHGGRLWAESEVGRGTTFRFTVPTREAGAGA